MAYMKRNVNLGLLFLIVATLIAFAGFATYYQTTFFNLSTSYEEKLGKIDTLAETLSVEKTKLNQTSYQLQVKAEREKDLSSKYDSLREVKEQLELDKALLQSELTTTKSTLSSTKAELSATQSSLTVAQNTITEKESEISSLKSQRSALQDQLSQCTCP